VAKSGKTRSCHFSDGGAIKPKKIDKEGLFKLDVDDDIWQDIGLDEDELEMREIPKWLADNTV